MLRLLPPTPAMRSRPAAHPALPNPQPLPPLLAGQVLAPLVRRFIQLRHRLLENDRAAKHRLDVAAEQLR